jgi:hypothetical protein
VIAGLPNSSRDQLQGEEREHGDILMLVIIDANTPDPPPRDSDETATSLKVVYGVKWAVSTTPSPGWCALETTPTSGWITSYSMLPAHLRSRS